MNEENVPTACRNKQLKKTLGKENENKRNHVSICRVTSDKKSPQQKHKKRSKFHRSTVAARSTNPIQSFSESQSIELAFCSDSWMSTKSVQLFQK